jgi:cytochrome c biogenesis protein
LGFTLESIAMGWRWLVRMRTALMLLGVLALMTAVATVVPQEPNVPTTVRAWRAGEEGPGATVSAVLDAIGAFDVYGSAAFLALLLALFLSLTACLIPRIRAWIRLVRRSQPPVVKTVGATDVTASFHTDAAPADVHAAAAKLLGARVWRVRRHAPQADHVDDPPSGSRGARSAPDQIAAEKGLWSREGGSLLFHLSFYVLLAAIVFGQLLTFEGQRGVVERDRGFTDTAISYWNYQPGRWFSEADHAGWRLELDEFEIDWIRDPLAPGAGQPTTFRSQVTITPAEGEPFQDVIEGNRPLTVDGFKIHQLDWGYAPRVEVEVDGETVYDDFLNAVASPGGAFRSAVKAPAADPDVGLEVFFYPFAPDGEDGPSLTGAPWDEAPLLLVRQWRGDLQLGATQQTVNELDTSGLVSEGGAFLRPGDEVVVDGVTIRFPELRRWVGFQVSSRPQIPWLLVGSALLVAGLIPALYAYRRRVWVMAVRPAGQHRTLVTVFGRAFQRPEKFEEEHGDLVTELIRMVGVPPDDTDDPDDRPPRSDADPAAAARDSATEVMPR